MTGHLRLKALVVAMGLVAGSAAFAATPSAILANASIAAHATRLDAGDKITSSMSLTQSMRVTMSLKLRNKAQLDAFVANPHHANLTVAEFMAKYGPTKAQVAQVTAFMRQQGFQNVKVTPNNLMISGEASVSTVQSAFHTTMVNVRTHNGRLAFANATDASVPSSLTGIVHEIIGLQTVHRFHVLHPKVQARTEALIGLMVGHNPTDFPSIYDAGSTATGSTVNVGIITSGSMANVETAFADFLTANPSLPAVPLNVVKVDGGGTSTSGDVEWDLDSQDIVGMSGGVKALYLYDTTNLENQSIIDDLNQATTDDVARAINVSLGECETGLDTNNVAGEGIATGDDIFEQAAAQGTTFSVSAGDTGADECKDGGITPSWPADSEYVVAVGGTDLYTALLNSTTWSGEAVWNTLEGATGGSPSTFEPQPAWQNGVGQNAGSSYRGVPDVAFDAAPESGAEVIYINSGNQKSEQVGGTSLASPLFVGVWARVLATNPGLSFAAPLIYFDAASNSATDFHDVTLGNNLDFANGATSAESAATGWDYCTGFGSIDIANFVSHLTTSSIPTANFTFSVAGLVASYTDASSDPSDIGTYHWNFGDGHTTTGSGTNFANPTHAYTSAGTYAVTETVTDASDSSVKTKITKPVTVTPYLVASFTSSTSGLKASFTDSSTGTVTLYHWNFGDGHTTTGSTLADPSHTYASAGTYAVTETVSDGANSSAVTEPVTVGGPVANFTYTTSGLKASFTDGSTDSSGTISLYHWNFGDGHTTTGSTLADPVHTYASAGLYNVKETVTDSEGRSSYITEQVSVSDP